MSILKDLATKRFWLAVALTIGMALLLCVLGAYATVLGLTGVGSAWLWVCAAWLLGTFVGSRYLTTGKDQALLRGLLNGVVSLGILWALGLTTAGERGITVPYGWYIGAMATGVLLAAALPRKRRRSSGKKGRETRRATRER